MFEVADINKDGVLDIVEFGRMVQYNINMNSIIYFFKIKLIFNLLYFSIIPQQVRTAKKEMRNTRHNYDIEDLRKYMNQRMEQSFQWLSKKSEFDLEDQYTKEEELDDDEENCNASQTSENSLLRRTVRYVRSFFQPEASQPDRSMMRYSSIWSLLPSQTEARDKLNKIESEFLEATARMNCKIIGEDAVPFSVHIPSSKQKSPPEVI